MSYTEHTWVTGELVTATKLNNMEGGIKNNETLISGMGGSVAPNFAANVAYSKGDYVFYEGLLYRFTANHAAGAWTGTDVTSTDVGSDLTDVTDACADLNNAISQISGLSEDVKTALLQIASKVAYIDDDGQDYYDDLYDALYPPVPPATVVSISAVYTQSGTVYDTDTLNSLKADLVVTALYDDQTTAVVTNYTLSGTLTEGTSTITVSYGGKTTTFNVTVTLSRVTRFGTFTEGYSFGKKTNSSQGAPAMPLYAGWNNAAAGRAAITKPIQNRGYVITSTDSSKYTVACYDVTDDTAVPTDYVNAVTHEYFQCGNKSVAWANSDSVTTSYLIISLKKNSGSFTEQELANGAEAVFTYTTT